MQINNMTRMEWLTQRERWASVMVDFDKTSTYKEHRVVWYDENIGWLNSSGQSFEEAVDNAIKTRYDTKTCGNWVKIE